MSDFDQELAASEFVEEQEAKKNAKKSRDVSPRMTSRTFQQFEGLRDLQRKLNRKEAVRNNERLHKMAKKGKSKK